MKKGNTLDLYRDTQVQRIFGQHHVCPPVPSIWGYEIKCFQKPNLWQNHIILSLKNKIIALVTEAYTPKQRKSWSGTLFTPQYLAFDIMGENASPLLKCFQIPYQSVYIYLSGFNLQHIEVSDLKSVANSLIQGAHQPLAYLFNSGKSIAR